MFAFILPILRRYWKHFAVTGIVLALVLGIYAKGRRDCSLQMERRVAEELERRQDAVQRERDSTERVRDRIRSDRESRPIDDQRDSCLLSGDPFRTKCVK